MQNIAKHHERSFTQRKILETPTLLQLKFSIHIALSQITLKLKSERIQILRQE